MVIVFCLGSCIHVIGLLIMSHSLISVGLFYGYGLLSEFVGSRNVLFISYGFMCSASCSCCLLVYCLINVGFPLSASYYFELFFTSMFVDYLCVLAIHCYYITILLLCCVLLSVHCRLFTNDSILL